MLGVLSRLRFKCDGTRAETRFRLSAKRTSPLKTAGASVQSTTASRGVRISGSNAGYTKFRGSVKSTGYPLHPPVSPSFPLPCVSVCHHISTGLYQRCIARYCPHYHGDMAPPHCGKTKNMGSALNDGCGLCSGIGDNGSRSVTVRHGIAALDRYLRIRRSFCPKADLQHQNAQRRCRNEVSCPY